MSRRTLHILYIAIAVLAFTTRAYASPTQLTVTLDSAYILMGKQTPLHINLVQDADVQGYFINQGDTLTREVEIASRGKADTVDIGSGRREIRQTLMLQAFDSGLYTLPPLVYVAGNDTVRSNNLALKVLPVPVDTLTTVHDYAGTIEGGWKLWDFLPDAVVDYWWILIILAIIALAIAGVIVWRKRHRITEILPKKKPIPPYELAMMQLEKLKNSKLCENGQEKEYYTRLTEILRSYLDARFGINAMEMTSPQIMAHINANEAIRPSASLMKSILEMADFVKFAKARPLPDDNVRAFNQATQFVEATRPEETTETDDDNQPSVADAPAGSETPHPNSKK